MKNSKICFHLLQSWISLPLLLTTIAILFYVFVKYKYSYWERRGIFAIKATNPCGFLVDFLLGKRHIAEIVQELYIKGKGQSYIGYYSFWTPTLLACDPELIKKVLVKDFDYFHDRGVYYNDKEDSLSAHLFSLHGIKWRNTRTKLNPIFSPGKIKPMYEKMKVCSVQLRDYVIGKINRNEEIEFKDVLSRHSLNAIANTAICVNGHSLEKETILSNIAFMATAPTTIQGFRFIISMLSKDVARLCNMRFTPKIVENYYMDLIKHFVEIRSKSDVEHNDFIQLLLELWDKNFTFDYNNNSGDSKCLTLRDVAAQTFIFISAAYETTATTLYFTLYELAKNPEIQEELLAEIDTLGPTEEVTHEQLLDLKYLDMVLNETLRKYPGAGVVFRECQKPYKLPNGDILEKGITVAVPVHGLHRDPKYYPNPDKYDPERFNRNNPTHPIVPFTYLPFGDGPRSCIGKRYAMVNTKISLFTLLSKCRYELTDKTSDPIKFDPRIFVIQSAGGMYLKATIRK